MGLVSGQGHVFHHLVCLPVLWTIVTLDCTIMALATPCFVSNEELSVDKVIELILKSDETVASVVPPAKPRSGEVYLFSAAGNVKAKGS